MHNNVLYAVFYYLFNDISGFFGNDGFIGKFKKTCTTYRNVLIRPKGTIQTLNEITSRYDQ